MEFLFELYEKYTVDLFTKGKLRKIKKAALQVSHNLLISKQFCNLNSIEIKYFGQPSEKKESRKSKRSLLFN
jgi:hypothetical protein